MEKMMALRCSALWLCFGVALLGCKQSTKLKAPKEKQAIPDLIDVQASHSPKSVVRKRRRASRRKRIAPASLARFLAVGNIQVRDSQLQGAYRPMCKCYRWDTVFREVKPLISAADVSLGCLETTLPGPSVGGYRGFPNTATPDSFASALKGIGLGLLGLASSHSYDTGASGLKRTVAVLEALQFSVVGAYASPKIVGKKRFVLLDVKGIRVAVLQYVRFIHHPGNPFRKLAFSGQTTYPRQLVNLYDPKQMKKDLSSARAKGAEAFVVMFHFGEVTRVRPSMAQRRITALAFRAGADVVIGVQPRLVQPIAASLMTDRWGQRKPRLVAYSLGNFGSDIPGRDSMGGVALSFAFGKFVGKDGKSRVQLHDVGYRPLWLHRKRRAKSRKLIDFRILPVPLSLARQKALGLSGWSRRSMLQYAQRVERTLTPGMRQSRRVLQK